MPKMKMVQLNRNEFTKWLDSQIVDKTEISRSLGKPDHYIAHLLYTELKMPEHVYNMLLRTFNLPRGAFLDTPPDAPTFR